MTAYDAGIAAPIVFISAGLTFAVAPIVLWVRGMINRVVGAPKNAALEAEYAAYLTTATEGVLSADRLSAVIGSPPQGTDDGTGNLGYGWQGRYGGRSFFVIIGQNVFNVRLNKKNAQLSSRASKRDIPQR